MRGVGSVRGFNSPYEDGFQCLGLLTDVPLSVRELIPTRLTCWYYEVFLQFWFPYRLRLGFLRAKPPARGASVPFTLRRCALPCVYDRASASAG